MSSSSSDLNKRGAVWLALILFSIGNFLNYMDRMLVSVMAPLLKVEFQLSDTEFGLLTGPAFVAVYAIAAIVFGALADRRSRREILIVTMLVWSSFTAITGAVQNFGSLLLARAGVGAGEAGYLPAVLSSLSDNFEPRRRTLAIAVFNAIGLSGILGSFLMVGVVVPIYGWHMAFVLAASPGFIIAALIPFLVAEPARGKSDKVVVETIDWREGLRTLRRNRSYKWLILGAGVSSFANYGIIQWLPLYLVREQHMPQSDIAFVFGPMLTLGMIGGYLVGGALGHRLAQRSLSQPLWLSIVASVIVTFVYWIILTSHSSMVIFMLICVASLLSFAHVAAYGAAIQNCCGANVRATATALMLVSNSAIGLGLLPFAVGLLSDLLAPSFGQESLRISLILVISTSLLAAIVFDIARRSLASDEIAMSRTTESAGGCQGSGAKHSV
jgi:MFS transporter, Spinster family, sphingosine-1-phosphate transporter